MPELALVQEPALVLELAQEPVLVLELVLAPVPVLVLAPVLELVQPDYRPLMLALTLARWR